MKKLILAAAAVALAPALHPALGLHAGPPVADPAAALAPALELPSELVPAEATLVAHVDVAHLRRTRLWSLVEEHGEVELEEAIRELGFDPFEAVLSVTLWGIEGEPEVAVVVTTDAIDGALDRFESEGKLRSIRRDGVDLWEFVDGEAGDGYVYVERRRSGERVVVLGDDGSKVLGAARVVRGEARSLADAGDSALQVTPVTGSFLFVAATGVLPGMEGFEPASQILGSAQGVQFDLGEAGGSVFAHLALDTGSVEMARDVSEMVQGLLALGRLAIRSGEEVPDGVGELLSSLNVRSRGGAVSVDFEYSVDGLLRILGELDD